MLDFSAKRNLLFQFGVQTIGGYFPTEYFQSISFRNKLQENITILSFIADGILIDTTSKMVTDLDDAEHETRQQKSFQRLVDPLEYSSKKICGKTKKNLVKKCTPRPKLPRKMNC